MKSYTKIPVRIATNTRPGALPFSEGNAIAEGFPKGPQSRSVALVGGPSCLEVFRCGSRGRPGQDFPQRIQQVEASRAGPVTLRGVRQAILRQLHHQLVEAVLEPRITGQHPPPVLAV